MLVRGLSAWTEVLRYSSELLARLP